MPPKDEAPTMLEAFEKWWDTFHGWDNDRDLAMQAYFAGNSVASGPNGATPALPEGPEMWAVVDKDGNVSVRTQLQREMAEKK
jgi:hypothetical protein